MSSAKKRQAEDTAAQRVSKKHKKTADKKDAPKAKQPKTLSSLLKDEGTVFPRGGGDAITPLERRQLHIKADRDALLEESRPAKSARKHHIDKPQKTSKPAPRPQLEKPSNATAKSEQRPQKPRHEFPDDKLTYKDLSPGDLMDGRVTRVEDYAVFVQLRAEIAGRIALTELADDYNKAQTRDFKKHQIIKVRVVDVDPPNKKVALSSRTSKTLSSTAPVKDPLISSLSQLKVGQVLRGFVKNVAEMGLFVSLSYNVTAFVRVTDISDKFLQDWRSKFEIDQLVRGRITSLDESANRVQMSLRTSVLSSDWKPQKTFHDFSVGDIVTGTVRKVEDYGAFVVVDDSKNVSGLCHRSELAQTRVEDARKLYKEGDQVKAKVLTIDPEKRKISFGLKASYFADLVESDSNTDNDDASTSDDENDGIDLPMGDADALASLRELAGGESDNDGAGDDMIGLPSADDSDELEEDPDDAAQSDEDGLDAGGFEWNPTSSKSKSTVKSKESEETAPRDKNKRKSQKGKILEDHTGDLDVNNPKTTSDLELLLLGTPNDADLWAKYISLKASEQDLDGARAIAERALRTIAITETAQKLDVWTVWFNLELQFGTGETIDEVFRRACEVTDREVIHERFASCCIDVAKQKSRDPQKRQESEKLQDKAQQAYEAMKKFPECAKGPSFWIDYARFLFNVRRDAAAARALLNRAKQSVLENKFADLVKGFGLLEFNCRSGDAERGRTIFASLLETYPRRWDFWEVYIAAEAKQEAWENVRELYNQITSLTGGVVFKLKKKNVRTALNTWEEIETKHGSNKGVNQVNKRRREYEEALANKESKE